MVKDLIFSYIKILFGLAVFSVGYTCFMLPYQILSGGVAGISALIFYATGFHASYSYFIINVALILMALYTLGWRFCLRTIIATVVVTFGIDYFQAMLTEALQLELKSA